ncbi:MAG: family 1 glycosylhydrolase [Acidimicrobiales bacterium]|nr:family 1 glycosylhydrolase [Acidimicrobiales bacterium]
MLHVFRSIVRWVASRRGVRVDKWLGDGAMLVAVEPEDAVATAVELAWRVGDACAPLGLRVGIASGEALLFEGDDYVGTAVNLAARLCEEARPSEVLATTEVAAGAPPWVHVGPVQHRQPKGSPAPIELVDLWIAPAGARRGRRPRVRPGPGPRRRGGHPARPERPHAVLLEELRPAVGQRYARAGGTGGWAHRRPDGRSTVTYPDGFWWGTAASATQAEGAAPGSDWRLWEERGRVPPSGDGNGFASAYADDFALLASYGLRHHRLSLDWARIEPRPGKIDGQRVEHDRRVLEAAGAAGVAVWACLHHFTLPGWFVDEGGLLDDRARSYYWPRFVDVCAQTFGDLVAGWTPINEPVAWAAGSHLTGELPPWREDPRLFGDALRAVHLAWRDAWRELRGGGLPVCTVLNLSPVHAADRSPEGPASRRRGRRGRLAGRAAGAAGGDPGRARPGRGGGPRPGGLVRPGGVLVLPRDRRRPGREPGDLPGRRPRGPARLRPWAEGLGVVLHRLAEELPDLPLVVAELGVGTTDDAWRVDVLRDPHGGPAGPRRRDRRPRVFFWTGVDSYEWRHGFDVPFGLFDRARRPRESAELVADTIRGA